VTSLTIVGAPTSAGAYSPGQEDGPAAMREQGIAAALEAAGLTVRDAGDVERFRWRPDPESPRAANAAAVADRARQVAERVAAVPRDERVLVLGGDCTVGVGTVAGLALRGGRPGLVYFDRHADLNVPESTIDGALDWMGVAHMLDVDGCTAALASVGGDRPLLEPERLAFLALGRVSDPEEAVIYARGLASVPLEDAIGSPEQAASGALQMLAGCDELAVHFDVDVLDFLDAPLAENTDRDPGVPLAAARTILAVLLADPRVSALTITELNPHHGAEDGSDVARLVEVVAGAYAANGGH
jgi:arginase